MKAYFKSIGWKRPLVMILGNIFLGMGVSIFKLSGTGNDAYNAMVMALADCVGIHYAHFFLIFSGSLFVIQLIFGRSYIGLGTIMNTCFLGYITSFFTGIWNILFEAPETLPMKLITMALGVIVCSFGISMYQTPNLGVSPYDCLSLLMAKKVTKVPYFWWRMLTDGVSALVAFLAGGLIGLGTLSAAFGFGPFIHFFDVHFTEKILKEN